MLHASDFAQLLNQHFADSKSTNAQYFRCWLYDLRQEPPLSDLLHLEQKLQDLGYQPPFIRRWKPIISDNFVPFLKLTFQQTLAYDELIMSEADAQAFATQLLAHFQEPMRFYSNDTPALDSFTAYISSPLNSKSAFCRCLCIVDAVQLFILVVEE